MWNLEKCYWWTCLQDRRDADVENRFVTQWGKERLEWIEKVALTYIHSFQFTQSYLTLCDSMHCSMPGFPVYHQLPEFTQTHVHGVSDAIQLSHPLSFPSPPAFNLSQHQGLFEWVSSSHQVAKLLELQLQHHSYSNEYSGLVSFRNDRLDLLAVQGTLKSLLQHHSSKASILRCLAFFMVQFSHPHMITGKTIALTFIGKVLSLLSLILI